MDIPAPLVREMEKGNIVLFLGAGANVGAKLKKDLNPPLGEDLKNMLCDEFLGSEFKDESLAWVSELAISQTSLNTVQEFIASIFSSITPSDFHHIIPRFRWRGIATTNYDDLVEKVYYKSNDNIQELVPFISDSDRIDEKLRAPNHVAYLKLHGCVSILNDVNVPLILTIDQYADYRSGRNRPFKTLEEWGTENTIVFVGHKVQDTNLRAILLQLTKNIETRNRYYLIEPNPKEEVVNFWGAKKISVLDGTFEDFLKKLDEEIPEAKRPLLKAIVDSHPIEYHYKVSKNLSESIEFLLYRDVEYIYETMPINDGKPKRFYRGFPLDWYPIAENLDVRRGTITDRMLFEVFLKQEKDRSTISELYLLKAEAGAGKSVFLKRLAWEASKDANCLCLFLKQYGSPSIEALEELYNNTNKRIFLFVDNATNNIDTIKTLVIKSRRKDLPLTVITTERINEWNVSCEDLDNLLTDQYQLRYLNQKEIKDLVSKLTKYDSLGPYLEEKSFEKRVEEFEKKAGRQLLVALHEATSGIPFQEIIYDEYQNVIPEKAQRLYLTICTLNRFDIPVRAGLISRVYDISFERFNDNFLKPLEHVVRIKELWPKGDYGYVARHPEIAQMVFERVLNDTLDRYNEISKILSYLNVSYSSDRESFRSLMRAKTLHELFPNHQDVISLFEVAEKSIGNDSYLLQQMANYERLRDNGNYPKAKEYLERALTIEPNNNSLIHTLAEVLKSQAEQSNKPLQRYKLREEARNHLNKILKDHSSGKYARVTLTKLAIADLADVLSKDEYDNSEVETWIRRIERLLEEGKQEFPGDQYILNTESEFSQLLEDHNRSKSALKAAYEANPRDPFIAGRLSSIYETEGDIQNALKHLSDALESNPNDKRLNYQYASTLRKKDPENINLLEYHFRRSYTQGDNNHKAKFWHARYLYESNESSKQKKSKSLFEELRNIQIAHDEKIKIRDHITSDKKYDRFNGTIERVESAFGFVNISGSNDTIFFHETDLTNDVWQKLKSGDRVTFNIGFNFKGPSALNLNMT